MTVKEARKIIAVMMMVYPNYKPADTELTASTWADVMREYSYEQVDMGLKMYMQTDTSGFAPSPGQIIDKIHTVTQPQPLNDMEAWGLVSCAIRNSAYHAAEEYAKLPEAVQKALGLPSTLEAWAKDENYNDGVARSHFVACYHVAAAREAEMRKIPENIRELIKTASRGTEIAQIEAKRREAIKCMPTTQNALNGTVNAPDGIPMPERCKDRVMELMGNRGRMAK